MLRIWHPEDRKLAGRLGMPCVANGGGIEVLSFDIPSSGNFTQTDLRALWAAGHHVARWERRLAIATEDGFGYASPEVQARGDVIQNWWALARCSRYAAGLVASWPSTVERASVWLPLGVPGGTEDAYQTELHVERLGRPYRQRGSLRVERSARWVGVSEALTSRAVAAIAEQVVRTAVEAELPPELRPILGPIAEVAHRALPSGNRADPDPSSWPPSFVGFLASAIPALAELSAGPTGSGAAPLLDTDELYEAWLATAVADRLTAAFGTPQSVSSGLLRWQVDRGDLELRIKPTVSLKRPLRIGPAEYIAVGADRLVPDLLLSFHQGRTVRLVALDAKAWTRMLPEEALSQSAKYLYGIRRAGPGRETDVPTLAWVTLVTSAPSPRVTARHLGRFNVVSAVPTTSSIAMDGVVESVLAALRT